MIVVYLQKILNLALFFGQNIPIVAVELRDSQIEYFRFSIISKRVSTFLT